MSAVVDELAFDYDEVEYPTSIQPDLPPDHIAAVGLLYGWQARDPATASILEIGCADGLNLIAIAAAHADVRCVGFDISPAPIARGRRIAEAAGIDNVELQTGDILTFERTGDRFDYVLCHGVYSWVPPPVREALLELIAARLAPGGVAYLGYDSLPGCAAKQAIIRYVTPLVAHIEDPRRRVEEARRLYAVLARAQNENSRLSLQLAELVSRLPTYDPNYVIHDWLVPFYEPVSVRQLQRRAAAVGLIQAADANLEDLMTGRLDDEAMTLVRAAGDDFVARAETLAMLRGTRMFRADLLVRADAPPPAAADPWIRLRFSFSGRREPAAAAAARYRLEADQYVEPGDPDIERVLDALIDLAPAEPGIDDIARETELDRERLERALTALARSKIVRIHSTPPPFTLTPGQMPRAGRLVASMLDRGEMTVNLRHRKFAASDKPARLLLALCDGNRSRDEIATIMARAIGEEVTADQVGTAIAALARMALFEA